MNGFRILNRTEEPSAGEITPTTVHAIQGDTETNPFARQELIEGWSQKKIRKARVLVIGAGAIANETIKNLVLLGFRNILVCDMDHISTSNLSRTVLFRKEDAGKRKAETIAMRAKEMALEDNCNIDSFDGDVVWELGAGVYRYFDVVLGCLDNVETRFAINRACRYVGIPWVDAGIFALAGNIKVFDSEGACYQCFANKEQLGADRQRYSCDNFKKRMISEQKMPTVQIASAIVSALQVQEAIKIIMGSNALYGKKVFFQGTTGEFEVINLPEDKNCYAHAFYGQITALPLTNSASVRDFLEMVSEPQYSGEGAAIDLRTDRSFLNSVRCPKCGDLAVFNKPSFRLYTDEVKCKKCQVTDDNRFFSQGNMKYIDEFDMNSDEVFLNMSLEEIGIPKLHVIAVRDANGDHKYYELSSDLQRVMPSIAQEIQ